MAKYFLFAMLISFAGLSHADANQQVYSCKGDSGTLSFVLNMSTHTITFKDIGAFGEAQILANTPFGATIAASANSTEVQFEYDWYYTAHYNLILNNSTNKLTLSGQDDDGSFFNKAVFACVK